MILDDKSILYPVPHVQDSSALAVASTKPAIPTKEEEEAAQKLLANGNTTPITLSAIGVGLLVMIVLVSVGIRRGLRPATVRASSGTLGSDIFSKMVHPFQSAAVFFVPPISAPQQTAMQMTANLGPAAAPTAENFYKSIGSTPERKAAAMAMWTMGDTEFKDAVVTYKNSWRHDCLMEAAGAHHFELVEALVEAGMDVNAASEEGERVLNWAMKKEKSSGPEEDTVVH
jgi:hypothetical protein